MRLLSIQLLVVLVSLALMASDSDFSSDSEGVPDFSSDSESMPDLCDTSDSEDEPSPDETPLKKDGQTTGKGAENSTLGRDAIDYLDDDPCSQASSLSAVPDPGRGSVDATNPVSRRGEALAKLNEERKKQLVVSSASLGISGRVHTLALSRVKRSVKTTQSSMALRLGRSKRRLGATAVFWNKGKLRRGDRLDPNFEQRRSMRGLVKVRVKEGHAYGHGNHPRAWTTDGVLELAYSKIGQLCPNRDPNRSTRRSLDAVAAVALAGQAKQEEALKAWHMTQSCMPEGSGPSWIFIRRSSDCTPCRVAFGQLKELADVARVWLNPADRGPSRLVPVASFTAETGKVPAYGIVEVLGQVAMLAWPRRIGVFVAVEREKVILPPVFLERPNGSTIFRALEDASDTLAWDSIVALTSVCRYVVLFLGTDLASSCQRLKQEYARRAAAHNKSVCDQGGGLILVIDGQCAAHVLHREVEKCFALGELIPHLYKTAWCCGLPGMHKCLAAALRKIVTEDLSTGFFPRTAPPAALLATEPVRRRLLEVGMLRVKFVRAQQEDGDYVPPGVREMLEEHLLFFNGDWRLPCVQHFCHLPGCCHHHTRRAAVSRCCELLMASLFSTIGTTTFHEGPNRARVLIGTALISCLRQRVASLALID